MIEKHEGDRTPSRQTIYSTTISRALQQILHYERLLLDSFVAKELMDSAQSTVTFPKKILIAGTSAGFPSEEVRRKLAQTHPDITLFTWDDVLSIAQEHRSLKVSIIVPISEGITALAFAPMSITHSLSASSLIVGTQESLLAISSTLGILQHLDPAVAERTVERIKALGLVAHDLSNQLQIKIQTHYSKESAESFTAEIRDKIRKFASLTYPEYNTFHEVYSCLTGLKEIQYAWSDIDWADVWMTFDSKVPRPIVINLVHYLLPAWPYSKVYLNWVNKTGKMERGEMYLVAP